jgi:hypothetical protein
MLHELGSIHVFHESDAMETRGLHITLLTRRPCAGPYTYSITSNIESLGLRRTLKITGGCMGEKGWLFS